MPPGTHLLGLFAAIVAMAVGWQACGQSTRGGLKDDDRIFRSPHWVPKGDPDMAEAMRKARSTLADFLRLADAPRPSTSLFSVKVGIPAQDTVEYFWIIPFTRENGRFSGKIDNEPDLADSVKLGDTITFDEGQIVDWSYIENDRFKGGYTLCALLKHESREQAEALIARSGMDCKL